MLCVQSSGRDSRYKVSRPGLRVSVDTTDACREEGDRKATRLSRTLQPVIREDDLLEQLRAGDDAAFATLVDTYHARLVRLARSIVTSREVAEEVVQETWLAVVRGIDRFEGRSSLRTWLFHICVNRARSTAGKESRTSPVDPQGPAADAGWFNSDGSWTSTVEPWPEMVDDRIMAAKLAEQAKHVIEELPSPQRQVVILRDVEGLTSTEVCHLLSITETNQRVLLHRGRTRIRSALDCQLGGG
jgi:RNA polymerase sigma-70 factor (ECF subfamily)